MSPIPTPWGAIAAVYAGSTLAKDAVTDALAKISLLTAIIVLIHLAWICAGIPLAPLLKNPRLSRALNLTLAAALVAAIVLAVLG